MATVFCRPGDAIGVKGMLGGVAWCVARVRDVGVMQGPGRGTASCASGRGPRQMVRGWFLEALRLWRQAAHEERFGCKNNVLALDPRGISLCVSLFPLVVVGQSNGGRKVHVLLNLDRDLLTRFCLSEGSRPDVSLACTLPVAPGSVVVFDGGYNECELFCSWTGVSVFFVTCLEAAACCKGNANLGVPQNRNMLARQLVRFARSGA